MPELKGLFEPVEEEVFVLFAVELVPPPPGGINCNPVLRSTALCIVLKANSRKTVYIFSATESTAATNSGIVPPYLLVRQRE